MAWRGYQWELEKDLRKTEKASRKSVVGSLPIMKQSSFPFFKTIPKEFGGSLLVGKRKEKRPMSAKVPIHLVLKSEKAGGNTSFLRKEREIMDLAFDLGRVYGVKVYKIAVQFNHIHFVIRAPREENYKAWIRRLTSEIVKALKAGKGFFTFRPFTKILSWGRQLQASLKYLEINIPETCRLTRHQAKDILQKPSYFGPPP